MSVQSDRFRSLMFSLRSEAHENKNGKIVMTRREFSLIDARIAELGCDNKELRDAAECDRTVIENQGAALVAADKLAEAVDDLEKKWRHEGTDIRSPFMDKVTAANALIELLADYRRAKGGE